MDIDPEEIRVMLGYIIAGLGATLCVIGVFATLFPIKSRRDSNHG